MPSLRCRCPFQDMASPLQPLLDAPCLAHGREGAGSGAVDWAVFSPSVYGPGFSW